MKTRTDKVTVFVLRQGTGGFELLQLRRCDGEPLSGTWQTIRGGIEPGETAPQTALRELEEETGLLSRELYSLGIPESFYMTGDDTIYHAAAFAAIVGDDVTIRFDSEHDDHRWVPAEQWEQFFMWPSERPVIEELTRQILRNGPAKSFLRIPLS